MLDSRAREIACRVVQKPDILDLWNVHPVFFGYNETMFEPSESFLLLQVVRRGGLGRKALPMQANSSHGATARKGHEEK